MLGKLFPIILALLGVGSGIGVGVMLKPAPTEIAQDKMEKPEKTKQANTSGTKKAKDDGKDTGLEYVKLNNQFIVPVVTDEIVQALVVIGLSIEITPGETEVVYSREPKLRDAFLQVMFDHANMGGFQGEFTNANNLDVLRMALTEVAQNVVGEFVSGVLITEIARQDV